MTPARLARGACPEDADELLDAARWALTRSLVARGETYHLRTCLAAQVNSRPYACSDDCSRVQIALAWLQAWPARWQDAGPRQLRLEATG